MKKFSYPFALVLFLNFFMSLQFLHAQWFQQTSPLSATSLSKVQFVSPTEGWISVSNGKLLHTVNAGANWSVVNPELSDTIFSWSDPAVNLSFINANTGFIIRTKGNSSVWGGARVYKTTNAGNNWTRLNIPAYDAGIYVQFVDENNGWILVFNTNYTGGGIFRTTNGGTNWTQIFTPVGGFPFFINSTTGWLFPTGNSGTTSDSIRKTTNGGVNWFAPWGTNNQVTFSSIFFSDVNNGWAVGKRRLFLKTTNGGTSWTYITNTGLVDSAYSKCIYFANANTGWIGVSYGVAAPVQSPVRLLLYTSNGGNSWTQQIPSFLNWNNGIYSIHFTDAVNGWFTGENGIIGHTGNGGVGIVNISTEIPSSFSLSQNYPNPFNPITKIRFDVGKFPSLEGYAQRGVGMVTLKVYDINGREVATLVNEQLAPGTYETTFDGSNLSSGTYFYKLTTGNFTQTKKLTLLK